MEKVFLKLLKVCAMVLSGSFGHAVLPLDHVEADEVPSCKLPIRLHFHAMEQTLLRQPRV